jgi:hypothetical protein
VAALLLGATGCLSVSVPGYLDDEYEKRPNEGTTRVFHSDDAPSEVAHDIADARPPAERRVTPSGVFMRYQKDMVGVVPDPAGGSRILLTSERDGYFLFFPYVGGYWGTYSGRGDDFRGGGPGAGK